MGLYRAVVTASESYILSLLPTKTKISYHDLLYALQEAYEKPQSDFDALYTGCIKKMVIELWSALARSLYNLQKSFFHSRKDQAFSFRMSPFL